MYGMLVRATWSPVVQRVLAHVIRVTTRSFSEYASLPKSVEETARPLRQALVAIIVTPMIYESD